MKKIIFKYTVIILVNLFAFLLLWNILDSFFETGSKYLIICLVLSVLSLVFISSLFFKKTLKNLEMLKNENDTNWK